MGHMKVPEGLLLGDDFANYMRETGPSAQVIPAANYRDELKRAMFAAKATLTTLPWAKTFDQVAFRDGEVSLWAGANGSGKSMLLSHVGLGFLRQGLKACILSMEMKPVRQLERMARQTSGGAKPTEAAIDAMCDWLLGKLWFYDQQGTVKPEAVYRVCQYAAEKLGCKHVIVDSLMKCVRGEDDYNAQKDLVDELTSIARDTGMHIHLVHHVRKPDDESRMPSKYDAKGSGSISDQVDNVFLVWRNKEKERVESKQAQGQPINAKEEQILKLPDAMLGCDKQRNGDWEGRISLWFNAGSLQYCTDKSRHSMDLIR